MKHWMIMILRNDIFGLFGKTKLTLTLHRFMIISRHSVEFYYVLRDAISKFSRNISWEHS